MAKKHLFTLLKLAAVALFVPYKVDVDRDGDKVKSVKVRSLALQLSYTAPTNGKKAQIDGIIPGYNADKVKIKTDDKTITVDSSEIFEDAKAVFDDVKGTACEIKDTLVEEIDDIAFDDFDDALTDLD